MSYILEALKKSDQERQIGHVPDIAQMQAVPKSTPPRWPRWLLLALLLNAVILVVLAWRTWEARRVSEVVDAPSIAPTPAATAPAARVEAPVVTPLSSAPPVPVPQETAPMPEPVMQTPQPTVMDEIERMPATEPDAVAEVAPASVTDTAPRWEDLPLEERANLPAPRIDVHVFAQEPERRFVLINLRKYQAGDTLDDGTTLDAILSDGIVLSHGGRQYRVDRP
ncbi:MAG TPA: general secretion pathway protein GspB [Gammaproteobacteria bacterium]|nr:general secretion pathway protein GspB [Gammaproteobacteria bacterium]